MFGNWKRFAKPAALSVAAALGVLLLSWTAFFTELNDIAFDFTLRLAGPVEPASPIRIVAVDEESLDRLGPWPWPRDVLARLVRAISEGSPGVIALDFVLDDPTSADADQLLADAIEDAGNVVLAARIGENDAGTVWLMPLDVLASEAESIGHAHADPDLDGVLRRIVTAKQASGRVISALAVETLRVSGNLPPDFEESVGTAVIIRPESMLIRFAGDRGTFPYIPAWEVLEGRADLSLLTGNMVLVGATAQGLGDDWMTPFSVEGVRMSGVEIHANAIDTIYANRRVEPVSALVVFAALVALVAGLYALDRRWEGRLFYAASLAMIPALVALSWLLLGAAEVWLPFPTFLVALGLTVPALEVGKLVRVNKDLDEKISRLSVWAAEGPAASRSAIEPRVDLLEQLEPGEAADRWMAALDAHERSRATRRGRKQNLLDAHRHNARWKLDAVDFFNEQLYRFVSFNNAVLSGIEDVIIVSDPSGQIVYQNPAAVRMDGYSADPPRAWEYISGLLDGRRLVDMFAGVFSGVPAHVEVVASGTGSRFYSLTLASIADIGVVATLHDVTAQQELNRAKNDMVSLVSHELRTPLTSIRGYTDMLLKYGLVEEKGRPFVDSIIDQSSRLNELIQAFLDVAYIESGQKQLNVTEFEAGAMLGDLVANHVPVAEKKRITIESAAGAEAGRVRGDRMLLYQALANLVANAIKYSPAGTRVRLDVANGNGRVRFLVEDEGYGIPSEEANRVFEKFYRSGNRETRAESGFGLGLAFVREVAWKHGGDVTLESRPGAGSSLTLWIPAGQGQRP